MMDVKDAIRQMALQGNLHPEDIARAQKITNRRSASDLVRNDPLSKKLHPLTLLAVRDLEETKAREREAARAAMEVPYGQTLEADLPHPDPAQELVNRYAAALQAPKSNAQREFESGTRSVGDSPLGAVAADPLRYVRDVGMTVGSWLNPTEWVGAPGFRDVLQALREREERSMTPQQQGVAAGRRGMIDAVDLGASVAMAPALLSLLGRGAANLGTRGLRAAHQRFNGPTALPQLEGPALNDALSTYSGYTYDPEKIRRIAGASALGGAAAMGYSPDAEAAPPKALLSKSLSNPAWLKAEIAGKHMLSAPQQQERLDALMRRVLDMERTSSGVDPEQAFALRRSVQRLPTQDPAPSSPLEQLNFEEFAGGGSVKKAFRAALPALFGDWSPNVVKPKGGNWLAGSVESALNGLKFPAAASAAEAERTLPLNSWIEGQLTKYIKTRMATPEDEVRRLAEEGVLHFEPAQIRVQSPIMEKVTGRRISAGFPENGLAQSPLAQQWERTSDSSLRNLEARDLSAAERAATFGGKPVPKETIVHEMNPFASWAGISDLGLPHLIDELRNALDPNSGLPRHLQLTPEAVKNLSMEKAVRRVSDINAWRAAQKVEANRKLAEQASVVREYAENNPKGLRWVELKAGELPEGYELRNHPTYGENIYGPGDIPITPNGRDDPRYKALADQLKYEGDTMGHCVGGYCDDVLSGKSRIFSLRDAKGEPHVTIETAKAPPYISGDLLNSIQPGVWDKIVADRAHYDPKAWLQKNSPDVLAKLPTEDIHDIVQIKGKQNRAPNEEYLPFVQDFVRNSPLGQPWSEVGDLGNTGLRYYKEDTNLLSPTAKEKLVIPKGYYSREDLEKLLIDGGVPDYNLSGWLHAEGLASGGPVEKTSPWSVFSGHNSADWPEEL